MIDIKELQSLTSKMSILYVEDDVEVQNNTKMIFEDLFKEVAIAQNGKEALEMYTNQADTFDIIITDINMPIMNGIELVQGVKKINSEQTIIIISAHNETEYFIDGIQSGIDGYILKPIDYEQLFTTLEKVANIIANRKENLQYKSYMENLVKEKTKHLEQNYRKMREMLTTDKITGLPNTNMLYQYLDFHRDVVISLFMIKIDNYAYLTQTYEKDICDDILKNCARFLAINIPKDYKLYRYSEDEFIMICESIKQEELTELAKQINAFFKETPVALTKERNDVYITFSSSIVLNEKAQNILQKARATLNELCKLNMFGHFKVFEQDSNYIKELIAENRWFEKIREIIEQDKLIPYFHPIIANETQEVVRYECLVRADDDGQIISPISFFESVRKAGLMGSLSRIMINKCFSFFSKLDLQISLNITYEDLLDEKFVDFVISKQQQYQIEPSNVTFEILEDIIFDGKYQTPLENLAKLKKQGFLLALDDFGSDRSNLSRFVSIVDLDYIKIDGQFIKNIDSNKKNYQIVASIISLAKELGVEVIAEYVSTKDEFEVVRKLGIHYSQGYYFYEPQPNIGCNIV